MTCAVTGFRGARVGLIRSVIRPGTQRRSRPIRPSFRRRPCVGPTEEGNVHRGQAHAVPATVHRARRWARPARLRWAVRGTVNRMMLRLPGGTSRRLPPRAAVATGSSAAARDTTGGKLYGFEQLLARLAEIGHSNAFDCDSHRHTR